MTNILFLAAIAYGLSCGASAGCTPAGPLTDDPALAPYEALVQAINDDELVVVGHFFPDSVVSIAVPQDWNGVVLTAQLSVDAVLSGAVDRPTIEVTYLDASPFESNCEFLVAATRKSTVAAISEGTTVLVSLAKPAATGNLDLYPLEIQKAQAGLRRIVDVRPLPKPLGPELIALLSDWRQKIFAVQMDAWAEQTLANIPYFRGECLNSVEGLYLRQTIRLCYAADNSGRAFVSVGMGHCSVRFTKTESAGLVRYAFEGPCERDPGLARDTIECPVRPRTSTRIDCTYRRGTGTPSKGESLTFTVEPVRARP